MLKDFDHLLSEVSQSEAKTVVIAVPEDPAILEIVAEMEAAQTARFILVGSAEKIEAIRAQHNLKLEAKVIDQTDHKKAAQESVALVRSGQADSIMKGMLHTSEFMRAILDKEKGLNLNRNISQISVIEKEYGEGLQFVTDCAIAIAPDLEQKVAIINNAVELAHILGYAKPKVALLSAVEVVNPKMPDTLEAAIISKMADRGQIKGAIVDGPLALDNAIHPEAAAQKELQGPIQGDADILVVPELTVGNVFTKAISFYSHKPMAAAIMGVAAPVIMTSRSDFKANKILSILLANYIASQSE